MAYGFHIHSKEYVADVRGLSFVIERDGDVYKAYKSGKGLTFEDDDASAVMQSCVNSISCGRIFLRNGTYEFSETVSTKVEVLIEGESRESVIIVPPDGKPAFEYTQTAGTVIRRMMLLRNLTFRPKTEGRQFCMKVDCSYYGGSDIIFDRIFIDGYNMDGAYDVDSTEPHIGIELTKVWNWHLVNSRIVMPGICVKADNYGWVRDTYFDGGRYGKCASLVGSSCRFRDCVFSTGVKHIIKSETNQLYISIKGSHVELPWSSPTERPLVYLDYGSEVSRLRIDIDEPLPMYVNKSYLVGKLFMKIAREVTNDVVLWSYSTISGSPSVSIDYRGLVVDNSGGTDEAVVDLHTREVQYNTHYWGMWLSGVGEARIANPAEDRLCAFGIDSTGNLYIRQIDGAYDESLTVDDSGAGLYDVVYLYALTTDEKHVLYAVDSVYQVKTVTFSQTIGAIWNIRRVRVRVPAGETLAVCPYVYRA